MAGTISKITKNSLANFSKAIPQAPSVFSRLNVSKLGFISASNYSQLQGGSGEKIDADDELGALTQKSKENMEELMGTIQDQGHEMKEKTKDDSNAEDAATDKAEETAEKLKEKAGMGVSDDDDEKCGETMGEKARQTVEEMWVVAKDTKDKIKDRVVGNSNKKDDNVVPERKVYEHVVDSARKVGNIDHENN